MPERFEIYIVYKRRYVNNTLLYYNNYSSREGRTRRDYLIDIKVVGMAARRHVCIDNDHVVVQHRSVVFRRLVQVDPDT